jgi:hypothetical protein
MDQVAEASEELGKLKEGVKRVLGSAKAGNTLKKYSGLLVHWSEFAETHGAQAFPVGVELFLLFLQSRVERAEARGLRESSVLHYVYAADFVNKLRGEPLVAEVEVVGLFLNATKRLLGRPTSRKRPLTKELVKSIAENLLVVRGQELQHLRIVVFLMLSFVMEGRYDDVSVLTEDSFVDYGSHMVGYLEDAKRDQFRDGRFVRFEDSGQEWGVCALLRKLLKLLPEGTSDVPIFRRVQARTKGPSTFRAQSIGYSTLAQDAKSALESVGEDPGDYGLHSARAGAASLAANAVDSEGRQLVPDRLQEKHGGWAAGSAARQGYLEDSEENQSLVPKLLTI